MKKGLMKISALALCMLLIAANVVWMDTPVYAKENATISISVPTSVTVGATVKVTITIQATAEINGYDMALSYNPAVLEYTGNNSAWGGGGGMLKIYSGTETTQTLEFKTIAVGSSDLAVSSDVFSVGSELDTTHNNPSAKITVKAPVVYSGNNNLASLNISNGSLSPAFNATTTTYTCNVGADVSTLVVTAKQQDGKAKVAVSGNTNLKYGRNEITVTVTAENGAVKKYVIYCNRATPPAEQTTEPSTAPKEEGPKVIVHEVIYYVIIDSDKLLPVGFTASEVNYKGMTVSGGYNETLGLTLIYLASEGDSGKDGYYIYQSAKDSFIPYRTVSQNVSDYVILPLDETQKLPDSYKRAQETIGDDVVEVMVQEEEPSYVAFYGMDSKGNKGWYRFCKEDNTVQKLVLPENSSGSATEAPAAPVSSENAGTGIWRMIAVVSMVLAIVFMVLVIALLIQKQRGEDRYEQEICDGEQSKDNGLLEDKQDNEYGGLLEDKQDSEYGSLLEDKRDGEYGEQAEAEQDGEYDGQPKDDGLDGAGAGEDKANEDSAYAKGEEDDRDLEDDFEFLDLDDFENK